MGIVGRLDQYASMLAGEFDDYSMSENLLTYSEQFDNAAWSKANTSVSANATIAPDGFSTADNVSNTPSVNSYISQFKSLSTNTTYTFSLYAKPITTSFIAVEWGNPNPSFLVGNFTLNTLSFSGSGSGTITALSNGWYRITHTITTGATATPSFNVIYIGAYGSTPSNVSIAFWGAQLEVGSVATDYTPTTTTAKTRVLSSTTNTNITGLSTYFSSGFSENVGAATTLVANVFPPYDLVYDDFGGTLFGAGQGRYMRQNTDKSVIVYNEIDEVSDFRDIVRTGLVLDLDAAQPLSYKGTGTTWNDLSGIGNNASLIGSPSFNTSNGGSIVFNGSNYASGTSGSSFQFTSDFSVDGWIYPTTISATHVVFDTRVGGAPTTGIAIYINSSSQLVLYSGTTNYIISSITLPINNWYHFCISRIGSTTTMYINSSSVGSTNTLPTSLTDGNCIIARTNESAINYFSGRISSIRSYKNKGLTATEVLQNYNALKHRFGL